MPVESENRTVIGIVAPLKIAALLSDAAAGAALNVPSVTMPLAWLARKPGMHAERLVEGIDDLDLERRVIGAGGARGRDGEQEQRGGEGSQLHRWFLMVGSGSALVGGAGGSILSSPSRVKPACGCVALD